MIMSKRKSPFWTDPISASRPDPHFIVALKKISSCNLGEDETPTPPKFHIVPEKLPSHRKVVFQPPFFRGYVKLRGELIQKNKCMFLQNSSGQRVTCAACLNLSKISGNVMIEGIYQFQPNRFFRKPPVPKLPVDLPD